MGSLTGWMAAEGRRIFKEYFAQGYAEGFTKGFAEGRAEEKEKSLKVLTDSLIKRSDGKLSKEEALKEAKELLKVNLS